MGRTFILGWVCRFKNLSLILAPMVLMGGLFTMHPCRAETELSLDGDDGGYRLGLVGKCIHGLIHLPWSCPGVKRCTNSSGCLSSGEGRRLFVST